MKKEIKKVYCDTGALADWLSKLEERGIIKLCSFVHENTNRKIKEKATPSDVVWDNRNFTWDDADMNWGFGSGRSDKFNKLIGMLGKESINDVRHLDTAYKNECNYFFTSDKKHILKNKIKLEKLLKLKIFHPIDDQAIFLKELERTFNLKD